MTKIAVLSSGEGLHFQALIEAQKSGKLKAEISCLITDKADCGAALKARAAGIRVYYFDGREVDPQVYDEQVIATLDFFKIDRVAVDGFDRPLTPALTEKIADGFTLLDSLEATNRLIQTT